jgi:protein-disulfide isomerase
MTQQDKQYKTHWHSFWFGFMSALSVILLFLLIGTITERVSFGDFSSKKTSIKKSTETTPPASTVSKSFEQFIQDNNIDQQEFDICLADRRYRETVQNSIDSGTVAGVKGTPHSFVLVDNAIYEIPGAHSEKGMREFFDDLLAGNDPRAKDISSTTKLTPISESDWIRGEDDAHITVIEYSDVDCPFCKEFHTSTTNLMNDYADDIRWVFRHMPIDELHPDARKKAEASECMGELGGADAFWNYIDALFKQS